MELLDLVDEEQSLRREAQKADAIFAAAFFQIERRALETLNAPTPNLITSLLRIARIVVRDRLDPASRHAGMADEVGYRQDP